MRILITNDDGINSTGLHMLVKEMEKDNEVIVAAPDSERSACGHSVTLHKPIAVKEIKIDGIKSKAFVIFGTPADCVKIGMDKIMNGEIDMVMSGINRGLNLGYDVIYSGTVSAAMESAIYNVPSIAVSTEVTDNEKNYEIAALTARKILEMTAKDMSDNTVLNVNIPSKEARGIKVCSLGNRTYKSCYTEIIKNGEKSFIVTGEPDDADDENTDVSNFKRGFVTVTPLNFDLTNYASIDEVNKWFEQD